MNALNSVSQYSEIVADTGEIAEIAKWHPVDCTTNPTLILKAVQTGRFDSILNECLQQAKDKNWSLDRVSNNLLVRFAVQISNHIDGLISCELDARLSFDTDAMVKQALELIAECDAIGLGSERILIKLASTWEGIQACKILNRHGIKCNMTLIFHQAQAIACAQAGAYLISPFVGRILDWYQARQEHPITIDEDPGVQSVQKIHHHFRKHGYETLIMAASFRNIQQILHLAGCDKLTISPNLLADLSASTLQVNTPLANRESHGRNQQSIPVEPELSEADFRWLINDCAMSNEKLAEGIRLFSQDGNKLKQLIRDKI